MFKTMPKVTFHGRILEVGEDFVKIQKLPLLGITPLWELFKIWKILGGNPLHPPHPG